MGVFEQLPYTNMQNANLDWVLETVRNLVAEWASTKTEISDFETSINANFTELKEYVTNYFDNLNLTSEIENYLQELLKNGTLAVILCKITGVVPTVEMFGADPTGIKDSTEAFEKALSLGTAFSGHGKYKVTGTISFTGKSRKRFDLSGSTITISNGEIVIDGCSYCDFLFGSVYSYDSNGLHLRTENNWMQYNKIYFTAVEAGQAAVLIDISGSRWINENLFVGGQVSGVYGVRVVNNSTDVSNNNKFENFGFENTENAIYIEANTADVENYLFFGSRLLENYGVPLANTGESKFENSLFVHSFAFPISKCVFTNKATQLKFIDSNYNTENVVIGGKHLKSNGILSMLPGYGAVEYTSPNPDTITDPGSYVIKGSLQSTISGAGILFVFSCTGYWDATYKNLMQVFVNKNAVYWRYGTSTTGDVTWKNWYSSATKSDVNCPVPLDTANEIVAGIITSEKELRFNVTFPGILWDKTPLIKNLFVHGPNGVLSIGSPEFNFVQLNRNKMYAVAKVDTDYVGAVTVQYAYEVN